MNKRLDDVFLMFQKKGFMPFEIPELVKDILDIIGTQKHCTTTTIDQELEDLGWGINIMDNTIHGLIRSLIDRTVA